MSHRSIFRFKATLGPISSSHVCAKPWSSSLISLRLKLDFGSHYLKLPISIEPTVGWACCPRGPSRLQHSIRSTNLYWIEHFTTTLSPFDGKSCCTTRAYSDGLRYVHRVSQMLRCQLILIHIHTTFIPLLLEGSRTWSSVFFSKAFPKIIDKLVNCEFACPSGQSVRQFFSKVDVSASSVEWVLIETKHHNCQRQQYLKWRFPMGSIPKYMFKFGWFGVTPFQETFILAAQTGHRRVVLISRHCSAWISLTCGPAGLDMAWQDLPDLAELQKANDNVQAFSCCGWMPLFETTLRPSSSIP